MSNRLYYSKVLINYYGTTDELIDAVIKDEYHILWFACRDYARRILLRDPNWKLIALRIDDFVLEATRHMIRQLPQWRWKAGFEVGSLHKHLSSVEDTILWMIKRWVSVLKNLFDVRYKNYIKTSYLVAYDEANLTDMHNAIFKKLKENNGRNK